VKEIKLLLRQRFNNKLHTIDCTNL